MIDGEIIKRNIRRMHCDNEDRIECFEMVFYKDGPTLLKFFDYRKNMLQWVTLKEIVNFLQRNQHEFIIKPRLREMTRKNLNYEIVFDPDDPLFHIKRIDEQTTLCKRFKPDPKSKAQKLRGNEVGLPDQDCTECFEKMKIVFDKTQYQLKFKE